MSDWYGMENAPKNGDEILLYAHMGGQDVVRLGFWNDGQFWESQGFDNREELEGWWSYENSVGSVKLEGIYAPTRWTEYYPPDQF